MKYFEGWLTGRSTRSTSWSQSRPGIGGGTAKGHVIDDHLAILVAEEKPRVLEALLPRGPVLDGQDRHEFDRIAQIVQAGHADPQVVTRCGRHGGLRNRGGAFFGVGRCHHVHPEARTEKREGNEQQGDGLIEAVPRQEPALGGGGKEQHRDGRYQEDEYPLRPSHIDQQKFGIEDEEERKRRGAQAIEEGHDAGLDRIATRDRCGGKARKPHGRRHIRHDPEVEDKKVHGDQRHDQAVLLAQRHDHGCKQRRNHDVVGRGRQAHPEDQRQDRREEQDGEDIATRKHLDHIGKGGAHAGLADGAHDDAGSRRGDADADHVARPGFQTVDQVAPALRDSGPKGAFAAHDRCQRTLGDKDEDHVGRGPEGREPGREAINHQRPDQHDNRQDEVKT